MQKIKTIFLLLAAMAATTFGDIFMSKLMRSCPKADLQSLENIKILAEYMLTSPIFWSAIACFITFLSLWLTVLSYEDLSFAMPMTATTYIFNAFLAGPILHETVTPSRWAGTIIIGIGVMIVSFSTGKAEQAKKEAEKAAQS